MGKSAAYCQVFLDEGASADDGSDVGVAALLEVALGEPMRVKGAMPSAAKQCQKKQKGHTWAVGKSFPANSGGPGASEPQVRLPGEDVVVPNGVLQVYIVHPY